uniref:Ig-like domain-containing protein n=1 Tax=Romanomermis culicivorax TaxID=13658 RepID=A0A915JE41_ROMCU
MQGTERHFGAAVSALHFGAADWTSASSALVPVYSILYVSPLVNPSTSCDSISESPLKQYLEPTNLESPVRITSERTKFCFVAPKTDKKNAIFINLTVSNKIRRANVQLWEQIIHTGRARLYDIDIERKIDRVLRMDAIKVECRRTKNSIPFTRNISIVPVIKASQGESCGGLRNLNCQLKISESSKVRFGFEWTLNGSVTSERIDGSHLAGDDLHLYRGPGIYKCHVRLPLIYPLQFNMKYGAPLVELVSAPFKVQYKCLSKQILEQLHHFQLESADLKRSDFALHLALALGAIIFCGALAGVCFLLATKTHVFDKLFGSKSRKSTTADTDIGTFDRGASILSGVKEIKNKKKSKR